MALSLGKVDMPKPSPPIRVKNQSTASHPPTPPLEPRVLIFKMKLPKLGALVPNAISFKQPSPPPPASPMPKPRPRPILGRHNQTSPLIWCAAIICAILATAVIISGIVVFIGYLTIKPKVPQIGVSRAQLDTIYFDQASLLTVQVTVVIKAENNNAKARASFYNTSFALSFGGQKIAYLVAEPFNISPNKSVEFNYVSQSTPIPLNPEEADAVNSSLRRGVINFDLQGTTRTRWRVGFIGSVKFWLHLNCQLRLPVDGTTIYPRCSSKSAK